MRIVALSDQHGHLPDVPPCDLLLIAGDVCPDIIGTAFAGDHPDRQRGWFDEYARPWLANIEARHKILTWGNHDWCGQAYRFETDAPGNGSPTGLEILVDEVTRVPATGRSRPLSIWATPWSRRFGEWAFMRSPDELAQVYTSIPDEVDILVSHQPPYGRGDRFTHPVSGAVESLGSPELLATIARVKPRLVVCGHLHSGFGCFEYDGVTIYNVAVVDEDYRLVRRPTIIDIEDW